MHLQQKLCLAFPNIIFNSVSECNNKCFSRDICIVKYLTSSYSYYYLLCKWVKPACGQFTVHCFYRTTYTPNSLHIECVAAIISFNHPPSCNISYASKNLKIFTHIQQTIMMCFQHIFTILPRTLYMHPFHQGKTQLLHYAHNLTLYFG